MKSTAFLATFSLVLFTKNINGQHNGLVYNEHFESNTPVLQQQPIRTCAVIDGVQDILNQNGNTTPLPNNINQHQMMMQTNTQLSSPSTHQIQLPPDLKQQPLQVQQYLQLQQPLQQSLPLQQIVQLQPQMNLQLPLQSQQPLQLQPQIQAQPILTAQHPLRVQIEGQPPSMPVQSQDILQFPPHIEVQSPLQSQQYSQKQLLSQSQQPVQFPQNLESYQPVQNLQPLQLQQSLQSQQPIQTRQPLTLQQTLPSQDSFQSPQPVHLQQPLGFQQIAPQQTLTSVTQQTNSNLPNSQIQVKWKSSNPQTATNLEKHLIQTLNNQHQQNFLNRPEVTINAQKSSDKPKEIPSLKYYIAPPQSSLTSASIVSAPVVSNCPSIATIPSSHIKPVEETYVPVIAPYNYLIPISEFPQSVPERAKSINSIPSSPSILAIPNIPIQSTNTQTHYYNQQSTDFRQNEYNNQNSNLRYIDQPQRPIALQTQPSALMPSQSSTLSSIPISIVQAPSVPPQYGVSSGYPVNTIVAPVYSSNRSKSPNLKSILPLIFNLLKAKITSCGCRNSCPCECKNNRSDNELEVAGGYSSQRDFGPCCSDELSVLNNVSEEAQGPECRREPKNCEKINEVSMEVSSETLEEEDSDEEEIDEDEDK